MNALLSKESVMPDEPTEAPAEETGDEESESLIVNPLKRVAMVIFSPRRVFRSLSVKTTRLDWILPIGLSLFLTVIVMNMGYRFIQNDQMEAISAKIEKNTKLSEEQKSAQITQMRGQMEKMSGVTHIMVNVSAFFGVFAALAVIALIMQGVAAFILHSRIAFGDAFKIGALGSMVSLVGLIVKIPLLYLYESFAQAKLSIGFLFPEEMQETFLVKILDFDLFTVWYLVVLCIGMAVFAKTSLAKALVPMSVLWMVYRIAAVLISSAFSGIGS
jgi:hypothetical protein